MSTTGSPETPEQRLAEARAWAGELDDDTHIAGLRESVDGMTQRLQAVVAAGERAADAIRIDAEEQASRHLAEAQRKADWLTAERVRLVSRLTDDLIEHATSVRDHSERMLGAIEQAVATISARIEQVEAEPHGTGFERPAPAAAAAEPVRTKRRALPATPDGRPAEPPAAALVRATQLSASGAAPAEIAETIAREFGIDPVPVLDRVLGNA